MMAVRTVAANRPVPMIGRHMLMLGCAAGALSLALADQARAQAFNANPTPQAGSVNFDRANPLGPNTETITVNSPGAVVLWTTAPLAGGDHTFLPNGATAYFQGGPGNGSFTVLNRISHGGAGRIVFDGALISRISAANTAPGGTVLFYAPTGILVGANARFDVGSLVLTTLDVLFQPTGNIYQPDGSIQFRAGRGAGGVQTLAGSQIVANGEGSNILLVAPAISHGGSIRGNGSIGYVAAESVDVAFNAGLFDIIVQPNGGTTAGGTVITHTGSTGGPASTGPGDNHRIYAVGVQETNAISLLLGGTMGYDAPLSAAIENGQIVLSSGYGVDNGNVFETVNLAAPAATMISTGGSFTSDVSAVARNGIAFSAFASDLSFAGDFTAVSRGSVVGLLAANNFDINVGGNVSLVTTQIIRTATVLDSVGGSAVIQANAGSMITIGGNAALDSSALGTGLFDGNLIGRGGAVRVTGNGQVAITGNLVMNAIGQGRDGGFGGASVVNGTLGVAVGGNFGTNVGGASSPNTVGVLGGVGQGGSVTMTTPGAITISGTSTIAAAGIGGNVTAPAGSTGGDGIGGSIDINTAGGTIDLGTLTGMAVFGRGGTAEIGGDGTGGTIDVQVAGGTIDLGDNGVLMVADGTGGAGTSGGGDGVGGDVGLESFSAATASTLRSGLIAADVTGVGGTGQAGGDGRGGTFELLLDGGNASVAIGGITANANGTGGNGTLTGANGVGGDVTITENFAGLATASGGTIALGNLNLTAIGTGGDGPVTAGDGFGGQINLSAGTVPAGGTGIAIAFGTALMDASAFGGDGLRPAGGGFGGSVTIEADGATARLTGISVDARASGTGGANPGFLPGGDGRGGDTFGMSASDGGSIALTGTASFTANGIGGTSATGAGGDGEGGIAEINVVERGSITVGGGMIASLNGTGGDGAVGGSGTGGSLEVSVIRSGASTLAATINLGPTVAISASGLGGGASSGQAGGGVGGSILFEIDSGGAVSELSGGAVSAVADGAGGGGGIGGAGVGGTVRLAVDSGNARTDFNGFAASSDGAGGTGVTTAGNGTGGTVQLVHESRLAIGTGGGMGIGDLDLSANGTGGTGPTGGAGQGGAITLSGFDAIAGTSIPIDFGSSAIEASGTGGNGGAGGIGSGGSVIITPGHNGAVMAGGSIDAVANGTGGDANGAGQAGGAGFGGLLTMSPDVGAVVQLTGAFSLTATGTGGGSASGAGGSGSGGHARLFVTGASSATLGGVNLTANGIGGAGATGGSGLGGRGNANAPLIGGVYLDVDDGALIAGATTLAARGIGGLGSNGAGGNGIGGFGRIGAFRAINASLITLAGTGLDVSAAAGSGTAGGTATGGAAGVAVDAVSGTLNAGALTVDAGARGGTGSALAGGAATGGSVSIGTFLDGASPGPFNGSATFNSIDASASAQGGAGGTNSNGGSANAGMVVLFANTGDFQSGLTTLSVDAQGGTGGGTGAGGVANGGTLRVAASGAQLMLGQTAISADATGGSGGASGASAGGVLDVRADALSPSGLAGSLAATSLNGTANGGGAGRWSLRADQGSMAFGTISLAALGAPGTAATLYVSGGTIDVTGAASFSASADIDVQAVGSAQYLGGTYALNSGQDIGLMHSGAVAGSPTFAVDGFAATASGDFTTDGGTVIQATSSILIDAGGIVNVPGQLIGGDIDVSGTSVTLALADGDDIDLDAVNGLTVTQAIATGDVTFAAGAVASFGTAQAGGRFAGTAASLLLPSVVAQDVDVAALAGAATLGTVTGANTLAVAATGDVTFNQLNGGAITLASSGGNVDGANAGGASLAMAAAGFIDVTTATTTGNISFQAGGPASFGSAIAGGSVTGMAQSLNLPAVTAALINVAASGGAATLGTLTGPNGITVTATGPVIFNQLNGGAVALTSSGGNIDGGTVGGASLTIVATGFADIDTASLTGNIAFQAGGAARFGSAAAGGSFTGTAASLNLPAVTAALINVAATGGNATLGSLTAVNGITVAATGNLTFNQLGGGAIALTSSGGQISGANANGISATFNALGAISVGNASASGNIAFQAGGSASFGNATAGGSFTGTAASLSLQQVSAVIVNVTATGGAAILGSVTGSSSLTATATDDITFNQLNGGSVALISGADIVGGSVAGSSVALTSAGLIDVASATATGNVTFQAGGVAEFDAVAAGGNFTGTAAALILPSATAAIVNVTAATGTATLGAVRGATSLTVTAADDITFSQLNGGTIFLTSAAGDIFGANATGTLLTFDAGLSAGFSGQIVGGEIRVVSRDIDVGTAARLGGATTQLVSLTARPSGLQTVIGGGAQGPGYTLTNAEAGRIRSVQLALFASAAGTAPNRPPDVLLRDLSLSATATPTGGAMNRLVVTVGGNAPAILQVEGAVRLANAGEADGISITSPGRVQVVTDSGSLRVLDGTGMPSGEVILASNNIWSASNALLAQLLTDPNFAGRNDALLNNAGAVTERGFIEGGDVTLRAGNSIFVQNSGFLAAFAGITVVRSTLTVVPTSTTPLDVFAFGRRINPDGTFLTNSLHFFETVFNGRGTGYLDDAQYNLCFINSGTCPGLFNGLEVPEGREPIDGPLMPFQRSLIDDVVDSSFGEEGLIDEPVTSGGDNSQWDCDRDDDGVCDVLEGGPTP